jgi:thiol:disulfide interchange protein DsbD
MARLAHAAALLLMLACGARAGEGDDHVRLALEAEHAAVAPGGETTLAVTLEVAPGYHVYWKNPGDSGAPTTLALDLPPGWTQGAPRWPAPAREVEAGGLVDYVYAGRATLLVPLRAPADARPGVVRARVRAEWMVCDAQGCELGGGEAALDLAVAAATAPAGPEVAARFAAARARLPAPAPDDLRVAWRASEEGGGALVLEVPGARALAFLPWRPEERPPEEMATRGRAEGGRLEVLYRGPVKGPIAGVLVVWRGDAPTYHDVVFGDVTPAPGARPGGS